MQPHRPEPLPRVSAKKYRGFGDVVERLAKPLARAIDAVAGTRVSDCRGCAARREKLNKLFPL